MNASKEQIAEGVLNQFIQLCRYPHPSYGEKPLADYVCLPEEARNGSSL